MFYEDVEVGGTFSVPGRTISATDLTLFAEVSGDAHPLHTDEAYAAQTAFGQLVAHGPFGIALAIGLFGRIPDFAETALAMTDYQGLGIPCAALHRRHREPRDGHHRKTPHPLRPRLDRQAHEACQDGWNSRAGGDIWPVGRPPTITAARKSRRSNS